MTSTTSSANVYISIPTPCRYVFIAIEEEEEEEEESQQERNKNMNAKYLRNQGINLAKRIISILNAYKIYIDISQITPINKGFMFEAAPKLGYWADVSKCEKALILQLNSPYVHVRQNRSSLTIIISQQKSIDNRLMPVLKHPRFAKAIKEIEIPWVVGFDYSGSPVIVDVTKLPNLLIGGASNFGKSYALKSLLTCAMWTCSPDNVQILIVDGGAASLTLFREVCHFVDDSTNGLRAIEQLNSLIEERRKLILKNPEEFKKLKNIIVVIDEYPALVTNCGNSALLKNTTQTLLQRGRHVKIFTIIAAQNPTKEILGNLDLGSVNARMAFHCPKEVNSRTILGENGAENLHEQGLTLVKLPVNGGTIQKLKGSLIATEDITMSLDEIRTKHGNANYSLTMDEILLSLTHTESSSNVVFSTAIDVNQEVAEEKLFADIFMWVLGRPTVSGNAINTEFRVGERRGRKLIDKFLNMGIVSKKDPKNLRKSRLVIPAKTEDLTDDAIMFLERHGYTKADIIEAFSDRAA